MKNLLPLILFLFSSAFLNAQCDDLFFSEYVEGYANNKALEIYNPTSNAINLSEYAIIRFRNGSTETPPERTQQLPDMMLEPDDVFVVVIDLTDTMDFDSQFDKPAWNGYNLIDTLIDLVTGLPRTDSLGNILLGPQFNENGSALFGDEYNEQYDLQCKADAFLNPVFEENNSMYFNGNDAVALIKGATLSTSGDNLVDVVGVIGEDPEMTIMEPAWVNENGSWMTRNSTILRTPSITSGRNALDQVIAQVGGTFDASEWIRKPNNSFQYLGTHKCDCNTATKPNRFSCITGPSTGTNNINSIAFSMYPNPNSTGELIVEADERIEAIRVFDMMGRLMIMSYSEQSTLNVSNLESGFYIVNIEFMDNQLSIQKLVIE